MHPYINLFGLIQIPTYGVCMLAALLTACAVACVRAKSRGVAAEDIIVIAACAVGMGVVGGTGLYILTAYSWQEVVQTVREQGVQALFGGMVFYGGLILGVPGALLGARLAKVRIAGCLPVIVPSIPLAHAIGRVGCFFAGCCYGCPTSLAIGVVYTHPVGAAPVGVPLLPVQLIEAALNICLFAALVKLANALHKKGKPEVYVMLAYLAAYAVIRFVLEFFRFDAIRGVYAGLSTSQWISAALLAASLAGWLTFARRQKPTGGGQR